MFTLQFVIVATVGLYGLTLATNNEVRAAAEEFLERYGYLQKSQRAMLSEEVHAQIFRKSILRMQQIANITQTGTLDAETRQMMSTARCGNDDKKVGGDARRRRVRRYSPSTYSWETTHVTWRLVNTCDRKWCVMSNSQVFRSVRRAFNLWQEAANINFDEVRYRPREDHIELQFVHQKHRDCPYIFKENGRELAHAFYPKEGRVHFDKLVQFTVDSSDSGADFDHVAIHEIGHALGLYHSSHPESIMYPYISSANAAKTLHTDDIAAIRHIYGPRWVRLNGTGGYMVKEPKEFRRTGEKKTEMKTDKVTSTAAPTPTSMGEKQTSFPDEATTPCNQKIDSLITINKDTTLISRGNLLWRIDYNSTSHTFSPGLFIIDGRRYQSPVSTHRFYKGLPDSVKRIAAAVPIYINGVLYTMLFSGTKVWLFNAVTGEIYKKAAVGMELHRLGFNFQQLPRISTAFILPGAPSQFLFVFNATHYWRLVPRVSAGGMLTARVDRDYPRLIANVWHRLPDNVDAVYFGREGRMLFLKDKLMYLIHESWLDVEPGFPQPATVNFLGCCEMRNELPGAHIGRCKMRSKSEHLQYLQ